MTQADELDKLCKWLKNISVSEVKVVQGSEIVVATESVIGSSNKRRL